MEKYICDSVDGVGIRMWLDGWCSYTYVTEGLAQEYICDYGWHRNMYVTWDLAQESEKYKFVWLGGWLVDTWVPGVTWGCRMNALEDSISSWWSRLGWTGTVNSSPPGQDGRHFADAIFRCIFVNENIHILIQISLKFVPKGPIENNPALV